MSMVASATEGQCASKISKTVPTTRFLWRHCRSEKAFVCAGMWATTQKVKFSLRAAYAELTRNVAIVLGNYNQKNRTIKKTHKETIVEGQSLTLICTCHTCAYAQCLRSTFLTKPLTPPCANQGFAYAKCSYDKALIKTIQNGFWGRSIFRQPGMKMRFDSRPFTHGKPTKSNIQQQSSGSTNQNQK